MKSIIMALILLFILCPVVFGIAQNLPNQTALQELIQAERNFAQMAKEKSIKAAFLQVLAKEAIMFNPLPGLGRKIYEVLPDSSSALLIWEPTAADIAVAGDLGYTLGPYEFRAQKNSTKPNGTGHFLTVWQKQPNGIWQVLLDVGTPHALDYTLPILPQPILRVPKSR